MIQQVASNSQRKSRCQQAICKGTAGPPLWMFQRPDRAGVFLEPMKAHVAQLSLSRHYSLFNAALCGD